MHNSGTSSKSKPTKTGLDGWIKAYGSAHATGMDPSKRCSKYYVKWNAAKNAFSGSLPSNIIIDAKTMKILEKDVKASQVPSTLAKYLP